MKINLRVVSKGVRGWGVWLIPDQLLKEIMFDHTLIKALHAGRVPAQPNFTIH